MRLSVIGAAVGASIPGAVAGFDLAKALAENAVVPAGDHSIQLVLGSVGLITGAAGAGIAVEQVSRSRQAAAQLVAGGQRYIAEPWGPLLAFFSAPVLVLATVVPFLSDSSGTLRFVDFTAGTNAWLASITSWWIPLAVLMVVAARMLIFPEPHPVLMISSGVIFALGLSYLATFVSLVIQNGLTQPSEAVGTVGAGVAFIGGLIAVVRWRWTAVA